MKRLLLLISTTCMVSAEPIGPFVFRVCKVSSPSETGIVARLVDKKADSKMCVVLVPCDKADFDVFDSPNAPMTYYVSKDPDRCK